MVNNTAMETFTTLRKAHQPEALSFEYCPGYIAQATRNGFFTETTDDTCVIYTKKTPQDEQFVLVTSSGNNREELNARVARRLASTTGKDVFIKNVDLESTLTDYGFEEYEADERWDAYAKYDDNTYPQQVVDVARYRDLKGPRFARLREMLSRFDRDYSVDTRSYEDPAVFDHLLDRWARQLSERTGLDIHELKRSQEMFRDIDRNAHQTVMVDKETDNPISFMSFSPISRRCLGHNAMLTDLHYKNIHRRSMHEAVVLGDTLGYDFVNFQGSETFGQYRSKRKLRADIEIPKKHLVYRARRTYQIN